jgi:hypothetical protein
MRSCLWFVSCLGVSVYPLPEQGLVTDGVHDVPVVKQVRSQTKRHRREDMRYSWKQCQKPDFFIFESLHKSAVTRSRSRALRHSDAAHCSRLKCLFSIPVWLTLIRSTALTRSSGVRNHAFAGESGKKNLCWSLASWLCPSWSCQGLPKYYRSSQRAHAKYHHQPVKVEPVCTY